MIHHGGNLSAAKATFGEDVPGGWIDLSTGINPVPYPATALLPEALNRLPEAADEEALIAAARGYYGIASDAGVIAAPGTQALIQWLPYVRSIGRVDVVAPTYGEYAPRWADAGHTVREIASLDEADADVVVIVNPNNPDGRIASRDTLILMAPAPSCPRRFAGGRRSVRRRGTRSFTDRSRHGRLGGAALIREIFSAWPDSGSALRSATQRQPKRSPTSSGRGPSRRRP